MVSSVPFRLEVARRIGAINSAAGIPPAAPLPAADRARVRTEVACEFFLAAHDREPMDARELAAQIDVLPCQVGLTLAWTQDGGQVLGIAPSAAAAAVLGEHTGIRTDTLAKLTWSLDHGDLPHSAASIGPTTLLIIDEAGMADTLSLDTAIQFAINRGARAAGRR
jgi:hypothetical protein